MGTVIPFAPSTRTKYDEMQEEFDQICIAVFMGGIRQHRIETAIGLLQLKFPKSDCLKRQSFRRLLVARFAKKYSEVTIDMFSKGGLPMSKPLRDVAITGLKEAQAKKAADESLSGLGEKK
jgi:hypothetical protein